MFCLFKFEIKKNILHLNFTHDIFVVTSQLKARFVNLTRKAANIQ